MAELMAPVPAPDGDVFIAPTDPRWKDVRAGITKEGADRLQKLVNELRARLDAWQAWATAE